MTWAQYAKFATYGTISSPGIHYVREQCILKLVVLNMYISGINHQQNLHASFYKHNMVVNKLNK